MNLKTGSKYTPLIHRFYESPLTGDEIEARSFELIDKEAPPHHFNEEEWKVVRRMVHTTGDFGLVDAVRFSQNAISVAIDALRSGRPLYVDSRMIKAGLSLRKLQSVHPCYSVGHILCHIDDEDVILQASKSGLPRSLLAVRKAKSILHGGIAVFGNSPLALLELNRLILEEDIRPAFVIAMPVGFVHVLESKEELTSLGVPHIAIMGRRGGSSLAVSTIHALCTIAVSHNWHSFHDSALSAKDSKNPRDEAIILMGHGSRVPGAGKYMEEVAKALKQKFGYPQVEICFASRLGPHFPEVLKKCVSQGAKKVIVIPYFLHEGLHMLHDIPKMMQEEVKKFPQVRLILGKNLGFDEVLVNLVHKRIEESKELCDVRELSIPSKERYPVPPGQEEFVPMSPEEALRYRNKRRILIDGED